MKSLASRFSVTLAALGCSLVPLAASAQGAPPLMTASSSGLTANVVGVAYAQGQVSVQVILKNTSNERIYITDARTDGSQNAFLGSGGILNSPFPNGIPFCNGDYAGCAGNENETNIAKFSYVDPGSIVGVSMQYAAQQKPSNPDTISFSITLIARFAKSDTDPSPDDVGPPREITLPFPYVTFPVK